MEIGKPRLNIVERIGTITGACSSKARAAINSVRMRNQPPCDTFNRVPTPSFDDEYTILKLNNGRIKIVPKVQQVNGSKLASFEMPEYLYHITSETNMKSINSSKTIKVSKYEQLPGIYLFDKDNFLNRYLSVGDKKRNLCKNLLKHAHKYNGSENLAVIRIPTESLLRNGKLRIRTQEDFFYYQDKVLELQKGLKKAFHLRDLYDDKNRFKFEKHILKNGLMTKSELKEFMEKMKQKIHLGYKPEQLALFEHDNAIEFIYNKDIPIDTMQGIRYKTFPIYTCINDDTGAFNIEGLKKVFGSKK